MRVLIVDDRPSVRAALRAVLEHDPLCAGIDEVAEAGEALVALDFGADVVLLGWGVHGLSPGALTKVMRSKHPHLVIVVLGRYENARQQALAAGADCYLDTNEPHGDFLGTLHELCPRWQATRQQMIRERAATRTEG